MLKGFSLTLLVRIRLSPCPLLHSGNDFIGRTSRSMIFFFASTVPALFQLAQTNNRIDREVRTIKAFEWSNKVSNPRVVDFHSFSTSLWLSFIWMQGNVEWNDMHFMEHTQNAFKCAASSQCALHTAFKPCDWLGTHTQVLASSPCGHLLLPWCLPCKKATTLPGPLTSQPTPWTWASSCGRWVSAAACLQRQRGW